MKTIFFIVIFVLFGEVAFSQEKPQSVEKRKKELEDKKEQREKEDKAAEEKAIQQHIKNQDKATRKRMKQNKRKAKRVNENKKQFFLLRPFKK